MIACTLTNSNSEIEDMDETKEAEIPLIYDFKDKSAFWAMHKNGFNTMMNFFMRYYKLQDLVLTQKEF